MLFDRTPTPDLGRASARAHLEATARSTEAATSLLRELSAQHTLGAAREVWDSALCAQVDPEIFFPEIGQPTRLATSLCAACPVRTPCLDVFGDLVRDGVVGGLTARERRARRVARRDGAAA